MECDNLQKSANDNIITFESLYIDGYVFNNQMLVK